VRKLVSGNECVFLCSFPYDKVIGSLIAENSGPGSANVLQALARPDHAASTASSSF
jgi:hypothetical protein